MTRPKVGNRQHFHLYLDEHTINAIRAVAAHKNTTASELIRTACREYLFSVGPRIIAESNAIKEMKT
ncbi:MAG TPA: hypothetical protein VIJ38_13605 [Acidobacteriaceae bacterium]